MRAKIQQVLSTLTYIRGLDSVHRFLQSFAQFLTEIQISSSSGTTHFRFASHAFHSFIPKANVCAFVHHSIADCRVSTFGFSYREPQLVENPIPFVHSTSALLTTPPKMLTLKFLVYYLQALNACLLHTPRGYATILGDFSV